MLANVLHCPAAPHSILSLVQQCTVHACGFQTAVLRPSGSALLSSVAEASSSGSVARLPSRAVIVAEGDKVLSFLQGLVTNDVRPLESEASPSRPVYAAILTPKGKFLHDVFVYRHPSKDGTFLIELDANGVEAAVQLLDRYKLRRKITFTPAPELGVWAAWGVAATTSQPQASNSGLQGPWLPDPRLAELGWRAVAPLQPDAPAGCSAVPEQAYRMLRYALGVAEGETEIPAGQAAPLDYNLDQLNGVSYTKGCYVGQERNSFTHYRGIIRKRLMPVTLPADAPAGIGPGSNVVDAGTGQSAGQLRGVAGHYGLAYLKLQPALAAAAGQGELRAQAAALAGNEGISAAGAAGQGVVVVPIRPHWWSAEWGFEAGGDA